MTWPEAFVKAAQAFSGALGCLFFLVGMSLILRAMGNDGVFVWLKKHDE